MDKQFLNGFWVQGDRKQKKTKNRRKETLKSRIKMSKKLMKLKKIMTLR